MFRLNVVRPKLELYFFLFLMKNSLRRTMLAKFDLLGFFTKLDTKFCVWKTYAVYVDVDIPQLLILLFVCINHLI